MKAEMGNTGVARLFLVQYTPHKIRVKKRECGVVLAKLRVHCYMKFGNIPLLNLYLYQNFAITLFYTVNYTVKI
jgi:hypothetical protein